MHKMNFEQEKCNSEVIAVPPVKSWTIKGPLSSEKQITFIKYCSHIALVRSAQGERMHLTPMQIKIFEFLIAALRRGEGYVCGKKLLKAAGSEAFSLCHLFKQPNWRNFIECHPRGFYRLNIY